MKLLLLGFAVIAQARIPRQFAAASLKLLIFDDATRRKSRIPRQFAAASLKLANMNGFLSELVKYSAAIRRGLIEALPRAILQVSRRRVFRGNSPRPH